MSEVARARRRNGSRRVAPRWSSSSQTGRKSPRDEGFDRRFDSRRARRRRFHFRSALLTGSRRSSRSTTWKIRNGPGKRCDAFSATRDGSCCSSSLPPALPALCSDGLPDTVTPATWPSTGRTSSRQNCEPVDSPMYQASRATQVISSWQRDDSRIFRLTWEKPSSLSPSSAPCRVKVASCRGPRPIPSRSTPPAPVVYLALPASQWWNDIVLTCSNHMVFFSGESHLDEWRRVTQASGGAILTVEETHALSVPIYRDKLRVEYVRPGKDQLVAHFRSLGLTGDFWRL